MTYLCYVDESGTADIPGNTSHFVLAGLAIPITDWRNCDAQIETIKHRYMLRDSELHVAWILRPYVEQQQIPDFDKLDYSQRRMRVESLRKAELFRLQRLNNHKHYKQTKKNFQHTISYLHLTLDERKAFVLEIARAVARWSSARLFAECIDKIHFDPVRTGKTVDEQAFEQIVSRFEQYLRHVQGGHGLLIHDNNETVAKRHTALMKKYHSAGTLWTEVSNIVETPLFVDSQLTSMVQIADLCAYALRRYLENSETELFNLVFQRADRKNRTVVGARHFTVSNCQCAICKAHRRYEQQ